MYNFNQVETLKNIRTKFKDVWDHKTTGNTGDIMPIYWKEIIPGDFVKLDCTALVKMTTPSFQTMDNAYCDVQFYFVPRRLVWKHFKNFMGEKSVGPHETEPEYTIPRTTAPEGGWQENTIADYLGVPTKVDGAYIDSAYLRSYALICNEWFRDQNRQDLIDFSDGDENITGSNGSNYVTDIIGGGKCFKAAKLHDYFTSSLLTPTGSERVELPLGTFAPVVTLAQDHDFQSGYIMRFKGNTGVDASGEMLISRNRVGIDQADGDPESRIDRWVMPSNLGADLSNATAATVNQLRLAFQLQKIFESNNIRGHRYIEQLKTRWNVTPSDATLQRPEYLGGKRFPLNMQMVVQSSSTNIDSPLGQISGFSNTLYGDTYFSHGFEEHGILMGVAVVRHDRTYQQGLSIFFQRKNMEDFYTPEFQNLGERAIKNSEIYFSGDESIDDEVFGYQEYAAEYRSTPNRVSGQFRSNAKNSFDNWHYADDYAETPVNGEEWIMENPDSVDRTLTVTSEVANQFYFDFHFEETNVRSMPPHSIPGFIDHH